MGDGWAIQRITNEGGSVRDKVMGRANKIMTKAHL
jgi:hypothetical protein